MFTYRFRTQSYPLGLTVDCGLDDAAAALRSIRRFLRRWNKYAVHRARLPRTIADLKREAA